MALAAASPAGAAGERTIASYCSPSGDLCYGIFRKAGVVRFRITTAARYFARYRLCVTPPGRGAAGARRCGSFPIFRAAGPTYSSAVRLTPTFFPRPAAGVYRVTWSLGPQALGPALRFRKP